MSVKIKIDSHSLHIDAKKLSKDTLFYLFLKLVQLNLIFSDNIHSVLYIYSFLAEVRTNIVGNADIYFATHKITTNTTWGLNGTNSIFN